MVIEKAIGRLGEERFAGLAVDYVDIEWHNAHKKVARLTSRGGVEIGLRLADESAHCGLRDGDALYADEKSCICVNILPCECIAVDAGERGALVKLCYEIGNRHAPFFYGTDTFLLPYDKPMLAMIEHLGLKPEVVNAKLLAEKQISGGHAHGHQH